MVIDEAVTLTGSYNWTRGAAANSEDLNLVSSRLSRRPTRRTAANGLAVSVPYQRREGWFRVSLPEVGSGTR